MPSHGKFPLKYHACLSSRPPLSVSITGAHVPSTPGGTRGFHRLNISDPAHFRNSPHPPSSIRPYVVSSVDPRISTTTCTVSLYATARIPPSAVYSPVRTITRTDPIQKLSIAVSPICKRI